MTTASLGLASDFFRRMKRVRAGRVRDVGGGGRFVDRAAGCSNAPGFDRSMMLEGCRHAGSTGPKHD